MKDFNCLTEVDFAILNCLMYIQIIDKKYICNRTF